MKTRDLLSLFRIGLLTCALIVGTSIGAWAEKKPYKIGVNLSLTGPFAQFSGTIKKGLITEQERINAQGGIDGHPLELIIEDNGMDITKMANIQRKFARDKEIKAIIGPFWSVAASTIIPITEREKIPQITIWAPSEVERRLKPKWVFNIPQGDLILAEATIDLARGRGYKKIYCFCDNDPIWSYKWAKEIMAPIGKKYGIQVDVSEETYQTTDTDMTPQILKFKDKLKDYDAIFLGTNGGTGSNIMRNLLAQGIRMPVIGTHGWGFGFTLDIGKESVEGVEFVAGKAVVTDELDDTDPQKAVIVAFDKRMQDRWQMRAEQLSAHSYDAIGILAEALKRAGENPTRAQLRDAIEKTDNFVGCTGVYTYSPTDHQGLTKKAFTFMKIKDNKFKRIRLPEVE